MSSDIRITCDNWTLLLGESLRKCVSAKKIITTELFETPNIVDIVDEERAVLFTSETIQPCNIHVDIPESFFVYFVTIVTDCPTLELFIGKLDEYYNTYNGQLIDKIDGSRIYRFDIELSQETTISKFNLKLIPKDTEIWIYGIIIAMKPCIPVHSFTPSKFNFKHIESILTSFGRELTPNAERCKEFLSAYANSKNSNCPNMETVMSVINGNFGKYSSLGVNSDNAISNDKIAEANTNIKSSTDENATVEISETCDIYKRLTNYVDEKIVEMEQRMELRLSEFENRQNVKLDKILELLNKVE